VHFFAGSLPRSDPEALAGSCRVSLILLHRSVAVVARWTRFYSCCPSAALLPSPRLALNPSPFSPLFHSLRRLVAVTGRAGTMYSRHSASSGDSSPSDDGPHPPPLPAELGDLARAGQNSILARIQMFVRDAGARGLRVHGITIAPAPHGRHDNVEREPAVVVGEDTNPGYCVFTVEPPVVATDGSSGRPADSPVVAPSDTPPAPSQRAGQVDSRRAGHLRDSVYRHNGCSSGGAAARTANSTVAGGRGGRHGAGADAASEPHSSTDKKQR